MPKGSVRIPLVVAVGLALAMSCGRTSEDERTELAADGGQATAPNAGSGQPQPVAGSPNEHQGGAGGDASAHPEGGATEPGIPLFDGIGTRVSVVGDHDGNALVQWDVSVGQVGFARWNAARQEWSYPAPLALEHASVVDTQRSGHPIVIGNVTNPDSGEQTTVVHRFDLSTNEWGPAQATGIGDSSVHLHNLSMDGVGNVYAFWLNESRQTQSWTWWPVESSGWEPLQPIERVSRIVAARGQGAWLWQESSGFGVRAFDVDLGSWGDEHELAPLDSVAASGIHQLVVGPSGEALAAAYLQHPPERVLDVWRYDPGLAAWQPRETAMKAPMPADQNGGPGPEKPLTDFAHHDIVAVPLHDAGEYTLVLKRRDAATGEWSPLREIAGLATSHQNELEGDDEGNLYGALPTGLFRYRAATDTWIDTQVEGGSFKLVVAGTSVFALGWSTTPSAPSSPVARTELVAYHHSASDSEWRSARGLPERAVPMIGSVPFAIAALDDDHAIVVWPTREDGRHGSVRAAFIE